MRLFTLMLLSPLLLLSSPITQDPEELKYSFDEGKKIYEQTCISCHGVDGRANTDMSLVVKPRDLTKTILRVEQLNKIIKYGSHSWGSKSDIMPSFKDVYKDDEIENVAIYIKEAFSKEQEMHYNTLLNNSKSSTKLSMKKGKKIFKRNCSLCHGLNGNGESEFVEQSKGQNSFIYPYNLQKIILDEDQIFLYSKLGGKYWGTDKNDMPAWKKKYNDKTLKAVARYIKTEIINKKSGDK